MIWFWLGWLCISGSWLFLQPVFVPEPRWLAGGGLLLTGIALVMGARLWSWRESLKWVTVTLAAQFLALRLALFVGSVYHDLPGLTPLLTAVGRMAGLSVESQPRVLFIQTEEDVLPFATNWDKFGLVLPLGLLVALLVLGQNAEGNPLRVLRRWAGGACWLLAYAIVRYLLLCGWLIEFGDPKGNADWERLAIFTSSTFTLVSYVPFAVLAAHLGLGKPARGTGWSLGTRGKLAVSAFAAATALGLAAFNLVLPGVAKPGRILVDDSHSGFWEPSLPELDSDGYGSPLLYNCSSLLEYLRYFHPVRVNSDHALDDALLRDCDVLVLKTPTRRYSREEIAAINAFVQRGGGLLLVGDHTNLLGMSSFLNEIASSFGMEFRYDASNAYSSGYFSGFAPPWLFAHPVVQGLQPISFMTTCTLKPRLSCEFVMNAHNLLSDPIDYSKPSFFGKLNPSPRNGFGVFPLAAARRAGLGRVAAFADSTTMSNFAVFLDDTATFYLRLVEYLNQTNRPDNGIRWLFAVLGVLTGVLGLCLARPPRLTGALASVAVGGVGGYIVAGLVLHFFNTLAFPAPRPLRPPPRVTFLAGQQFRYAIPPAIGPSWIPVDKAFDSLFVLPQRFGVFPRLVPPSDLARLPADRIVAINPKETISAADIAELSRLTAAGGHLLVLSDPDSTNSLVQQVAGASEAQLVSERRFELPPLSAGLEPATRTNAEPRAPETTTLTNAATLLNVPANVAQAMATNANLLPPLVTRQLRTNVVTCSVWRIGAGKAYVLSDSSLFSRWWLGNVMTEPAPAQRQAYAVIGEVFREFFGDVDRPK
jgi:hypothetical protein